MLDQKFYLSRIELHNFRLFDSSAVNFNPGINVIVGENGYGKTTLLDAIASGIGGSPFTDYTKPLKSYNKIDVKIRRITERDIKRDKTGHLNYQADLFLSFLRGNNYLDIHRSRISRKEFFSDNSISQLFARGMSASAIQENSKLELPLFAFYGTGRLYLKRFSRGKLDDNKIRFGDRLSAYDGCLEPSSNEQFLKTWFSPEKLRYLSHSRSEHLFQELLSILQESIPGKPKVSVSKDKKEMLFQFSNSESSLSFDFLSDGQKAMIAMIADISIRCLILNRNSFANEVIKNTSGVVLIDEIDLHIHPKWQREIIDNLKNAFPRLQFIITTHSPFVIQSLEDGELVRLNSNSPNGKYVNQSLEDIVEEIQGVENPQWSKKREEMFDTALNVFKQMKESTNLTENQKNNLKNKILSSINPYSDNMAYCAFIKLKMIENGLNIE